MIYSDLSKFFNEALSEISCQRDTKAYIVGIFHKYRRADHDYSQYSVGLMFAQARETHNFIAYQDLADWLFFINSLNPEHLKHASPEYFETIAKLSYYSCYRLINKQWKLFEELADRFSELTQDVRLILPNSLNYN